MHLLSALPLLTLAVGVLAHAHNNTPHGRSPARHPPTVRYEPLGNAIDKRVRRATTDDDEDGLIGGLLSGDETTSKTSAATTRPVSSAVVATSSALRTTTPPLSSTISSALPVSSTASISASSVISASSNSTSPSSGLLSTSLNATSTSSSSISSTSSSIAQSSESGPVTTITTDDRGQTAVITKFLTATPSSDAAQTSAASDKKDNDGGISTGAIIGISVGVGVVVLSLIGCAIWRMKRRHGDEDEAIRWPELNRHGDSDVHHALPAKQTGKHGFATSPLERSLSNSSSIFAPSTVAPPHSAPPMALNGSNFGATSSLEDYEYDEKAVPPLPHHADQSLQSHHAGTTGVYDHEDDYTNMPPPVQMEQIPTTAGYGGYESEVEDGLSHGHVGGHAGYGQAGIGAGTMAMPEPQVGANVNASSPFYHSQ